MGLFHNYMMAAAASTTGGGVTPSTINNSCRFDSASSAYMSRTYGTGGDQDKWTLSFWLKQCKFGASQYIFGSGANSGSTFDVLINSSNQLQVLNYVGSYQTNLITSGTFTDQAQWQHIVIVYDSAQSTAADRVTIYLDGSEITSFGTATYPSQNTDSVVGSNTEIGFGRHISNGSDPADIYLSDINYVNGEAKTATSFGMDDSGTWKPIAYSGTYGTGGFYLDFASSGDLGNDVSGNNNDMSTSGLASNDQVTDTPTSNKAILNPKTDTAIGHLSAATISEGGLKITVTASSLSTRAPATLKVSSGKWYWEGKYTGTTGGQNYGHFGIWDSGTDLATSTIGGGAAADNEWFMSDDATQSHDGSDSSTGLGNWTLNDIIQISIDLDADKLWFGRQNTFDGDPANGTGESFSSIGNNIVPVTYAYGGGDGQGSWELNFGQHDFTYTPPSGFEAIASDNAQEETVSVAPTPT